jgi:hypothetical protein
MNNIIRNDINSIYSLIYFIILSLIFLSSLFYGYSKLLNITTNEYIYYIFFGILLAFYIIFMGIYYLNWNLEGIFILILIISVIMGILAFIIIYYSQSICEENKKDIEIEWIKYIFIFMIIIILIIGLYDINNDKKWNIYDTLRFIILLIIIRILYYISKKYEMKYYKTLLDIIMIIVLFFNGKRIFLILNSVPEK